MSKRKLFKELDSKQINKNNYYHSLHNFKNKTIEESVKQIENSYLLHDYYKRDFAGWDNIDVLIDLVKTPEDPNMYKSNILTNKIQNDSKKYLQFFQSNVDSMIDKKRRTKPKTEIKSDSPKKEKIHIQMEIHSIMDLLTLIQTYPYDETKEYNIQLESLHKIKEPLEELIAMIGMKTLKENIVDQILFYVQNLHISKSDLSSKTDTCQNIDFMHTVIYGPPGTGKTEIAKIIGKIFSKLGILNKGTFTKVTRSDLISGYLGQTALKTRDVIKDSLGGVLFIDEAYALGNSEKRDSFSKECIDTLCEALSDHKDNLMVIIAGYEEELNECFFSYNQGLQSRFTWRFKTDKYTSEDLHKIFLKKVMDGGWTIAENHSITTEWFEKNKVYFAFFGRDIETLFAKTKIAHSRRVFCLPETEKKKLTKTDLDKGLEMYVKNEHIQNRKNKEEINKMISSIYI